MSIDIIIIHYGDLETTKRCLESVEKCKDEYRSVILINNDAAIDLTKALRESKQRTIINAGRNLGFAKAVNVGIKHALNQSADYIVLLNNDASIEKKVLSTLASFLNDSKTAGIAGPVISFRQNGKLLFDYGGNIGSLTGRTTHDNRDSNNDKRPKKADYVSGCCMMVKSEVIEKVGFFDEQFFMYYEDVDYCLRTREAGYDTWVVPEGLIFHELSKSIKKGSDNATYHLIKSGMLFGRKHRQFIFSKFFIQLQSVQFILKNPRLFKVAFHALFLSN